jgi:hypothetical protein
MEDLQKAMGAMGGKMPEGMNMEDLQKAMGGKMPDQTDNSSPAVEEVD